jgi:hypothetical protein
MTLKIIISRYYIQMCVCVSNMYRYLNVLFFKMNVNDVQCSKCSSKCMLSFFNLQEVGLALGVRVCSIYK